MKWSKLVAIWFYFFYQKQLINVNSCNEKNDPLKQKHSSSENWKAIEKANPSLLSSLILEN